MNRRGFLKLLGVGVAAGAALTTLPVDAFDSLVYQPKLPAGPIAVVDFETMVRRVAVAMQRALTHPVQSLPFAPGNAYSMAPAENLEERYIPPEYRIGEHVLVGRTTRPVLLDRLYGCSGDDLLRLEPGVPYDARQLDVYGDMLAFRANRDGVNLFAPLELPPSVDQATNVRIEDGPIVRGVICWSVIDAMMICRFDVLGGRA